ncbi:MAG: AMP-binding protein [Deltaproteobacteria bacterium HGW-Deltaproteobacteria-19]|nr:MAG: AMP-binding protein [Deltaproteobacteria bacterium HGW-Deltaproteobacteria-19]
MRSPPGAPSDLQYAKEDIMEPYFDDRETLRREERLRIQVEALSRMVEAARRQSTVLRKGFEDLGVNPGDIKTVADFERLPVISRERLVEMELERPPYAGLENPDAEIDRIFISPGPVYEPHLGEEDVLWARAYKAAGLAKGDVVLNAFSYHMVAAGLTFHGGLRKVGATVIPSGASSAQAQVQLIRDLGATAYTGTPSFLMAIIEKAREMGYDFRKDFRVRKACFAAEPLFPAMRERFETEFGIDTYQMYGATEVGDVAYECREKKGWHLCEEVYVEIVDPATGKAVPPGTPGEIVVTRFNDIFYLFRFGTGDLSRIVEEPCPCGRTSYRLAGILGRVGDAVKVRGLFVAPSQLQQVDAKFPEIRKFQIVVGRSGHEDRLNVRIDPAEPSGDFSSLEQAFHKAFREICTVRIDRIEFLKPGTLTDEDRRIVDERSWK